MLTDADVAVMRANRDELVADRSLSIVIRRGSSELAAQTVRVARLGMTGRAMDGAGTEESRTAAVVMGDTTLDIQANDRFIDEHGHVYRVTVVRPNQSAGVTAEAELVQ